MSGKSILLISAIVKVLVTIRSNVNIIAVDANVVSIGVDPGLPD